MTEDKLKNQQNFNTLSEYVMSDKIYTCKLPNPKDFNITFRFADGEEAVFKNARSLQEFIDKMNNFHELEKENKQLKEKLDACAWALDKIADVLVKHKLVKK